jgi:16S rRNA (adenine1518-N6/adenine1519-N6)-dimethyltransferase
MLRSSLRPVAGALEAAESLGIDLQRRAETLAVEEWVKLAGALSSFRP